MKNTKDFSFPWTRKDLLIAFVVFLGAGIWGDYYFRTWGYKRAEFYQGQYGPAVMIALGKGYVAPTRVPEITRFLKDYRSAAPLDVSKLPESIPTRTFGRMERGRPILMHLVGWTWRLTGISWRNLAPLMGALYGFNAAALYCIFRIFCGLPLALMGTALLVFSPVQLLHMPNLRDFSKSPYILLVLALLGLAVHGRHSRKGVLLNALLLGAVIGVGIAFRSDVRICLPIAMAVLLLFSPRHSRKDWATRLAGLVILFLSYKALASLNNAGLYTAKENLVKSTGRSPAHELIEGRATAFQEHFLQTSTTPYESVYVYSDMHAYVNALSFGARVLDTQTTPIQGLRSKEYGPVAKAYYIQLMKTFPADFVISGYAAVLRTLTETPFMADTAYLGVDPLLQKLYIWRWRLFGFLWHAALPLAIAIGVILAAARIRLGLAWAFILVISTAYVSVQYDLRHYFHLEFWSWLCLGIAIQWLWNAVRWMRSPDNRAQVSEMFAAPKTWWKAAAFRIAVVATLVVAGLGLPLAAARAWQDRTVGNMYEAFAAAELKPLQCEITGNTSKRIEFGPLPRRNSMFAEDADVDGHSGYIALDLMGQGEPVDLAFLLRRDSRVTSNLNLRTRVQAGTPERSGITRVFMPIHAVEGPNLAPTEIGSVRIPERQSKHLVGVHYVENLDEFPLLPFYIMYPDWDERPTYRSLRPRTKPYWARRRLAERNNLLSHGGYETLNPAALEPKTGSLPADLSIEKTRVHEGGSALRIAWRRAAPVHFFLPFENMPLEPDTAYEIFFWADKISGNTMALTLFGAGQEKVRTLPFVGPKIFMYRKDGYYEYSGVFRTPPGEPLKLALQISRRTGDGFPCELILDDIRLRKLDEMPNLTTIDRFPHRQY